MKSSEERRSRLLSDGENSDRKKFISNIRNIRFLKPVIPAGVIFAIILVALSGYEAPVYEAKTPEITMKSDTSADVPAITLPDTTALPEEARESGTPSAGAIKTLEAVDDADATYLDGTYTGSAQGFGGPVSVRVTISDGKISDITVISASGETPDYFNRATAVIDRMLNAQSTNVDVVSGATYSSNGIIQAVRNALAKASGGVANTSAGNDIAPTKNAAITNRKAYEPAPALKQADESNSIYTDGVYVGTGEGWGGMIDVRVIISGGNISKIEIISAPDESEEYFAKAKVLVDTIVKAQSTNVDTITSATYSSNGIIEAVRDALQKALKKSDSADSGMNADSEEADSGDNTSDSEDTSNTNTVQSDTGESGESKTDGSESDGNTDNQDSGNDQTESGESGNAESGDQTSDDTGSGNDKTNDSGQSDSGSGETEKDPEPVVVTKSVTVTVYCDDEGDFDDYDISMDIEIEDDKVISIDSIINNSDSVNRQYTMVAAYGNKAGEKISLTGRPKMIANKAGNGVVTQILEKGSSDGVDVVSGATCSSEAIKQAVRNALE